jgi:cytochrome P450
VTEVVNRTSEPDELIGRLVAAQENPYPLHNRLRELAPVHPVRFLDAWLLTRRSDATTALRDPRFGHLYIQQQERLWGREIVERSRLLQTRARWMAFSNPPEHTKTRGLVDKVFTPRAVEVRAPRIQQFVAERLAEILERGEMDVVVDFTHPITTDTIGDLLGVPTADRRRFKQWGPVFDALPGTDRFETAESIFVDYLDYFTALVVEKRRSPGDDLVSDLMAVEVEGEPLQDRELATLAVSLFGAGFDTTRHLIANAVYALLTYPSELAVLRRDPSLMRNAIDEFLRFDPPVQFASRTALEDVDLAGRQFARGDWLMVDIAAANRDPDVHAEPDRLDVRRSRPQPLSFGGGIHHCVGAALGRLEASIVLNSLLAHCADLTLAGPPRWQTTFVFHGLEHLPVAFNAA